MRTLLVATLLALSCGKTYQEIGVFPCPTEHYCPDPLVCVNINGTGQCLAAEPCDLQSSTACPIGNEDPEFQRARCTLLRTAPGVASAECVHLFGTIGEGAGCQLLFAGYFTGAAGGYGSSPGTNFPLEDRSCGKGLICHSYELLPALSAGTDGLQTAPGVCRAYCKADSDCGPGKRCLDAFNANVTAVTVSVTPRPGVCVPTCTLLGSPSGCATGQECTIADNIAPQTGQGLCVTPNNSTPMGSCNAGNRCGDGLACVPDGLNRSCKKICRISTGGCATGETCKASPLVLSEPDVGVCSS